jgi:hypothetical protein
MTKRSLGLVASMLAVPLEAHAHGDASWSHGVADGARVFAGSLQYLLPVLAAALIARRGSHASLRNDAFSIVGGISLGMFGGYVVTDALTVVVLARIQLVSLLSILAGGLVGLEHGVTPSGDPLAGPQLALGFLLSAAAVFTVTGLISHRFRTGWQRIAIRVVGSWLAAIGAIYVAFLIKQVR